MNPTPQKQTLRPPFPSDGVKLLDGLDSRVLRQSLTSLSPIDAPLHELRHDRDHLVDGPDELERGVSFTVHENRKKVVLACRIKGRIIDKTPGRYMTFSHSQLTRLIGASVICGGQEQTHRNVIVLFCTAKETATLTWFPAAHVTEK